jgi:hypothetical protein
MLKVVCWALIFLAAPMGADAEPTSAAVSAFDSYIAAVESRIARQHRSADSFLAPVSAKDEEEIHRGELAIEQVALASGSDLPGAMLHHWRGTAFTPGATAADFERLMRNFKGYPQYFSPQVVRAGATEQKDGRLQAWMRVRQQHVITIVMDADYDVAFGRLDARHGYSISQSTRIAEIDSPGSSSERPLSVDQDHGFLWRLNTYWSYEERDGGLYMQIESVSLTRSIPPGLGWAVKPFVESVPRESLEFTLRSACDALRK